MKSNVTDDEVMMKVEFMKLLRTTDFLGVLFSISLPRRVLFLYQVGYVLAGIMCNVNV